MKTLLITGIAGKSGLVLARLIAEGGLGEPTPCAWPCIPWSGPPQRGSCCRMRNTAVAI